MKEDNRYIRQEALPQVGKSGQQKLQEASVLVVGCGGLGCAMLPYLVGSGICKIGIVDGDVVSKSNLHRQVLFTQSDVGQLKVEIAALELQAQNDDVTIHTYPYYLDGDNALSLFKNYNIIVDATDRIPIRYLINDACILTGKPFVHAALYRFQIQVSVFNYKNGPTYRCLYPEPASVTQSCDTAGVLGSTVAIAGALQVNEVMKIILDVGTVLSGQVLLKDVLKNAQQTFLFKKDETIAMDMAFFQKEHRNLKVDFAFAKAENHMLLDVRTATEYPRIKDDKVYNIPLGQLENSIHKIPKDTPISIFCKSGKRSEQALHILKKYNYQKLYCLNENAVQIYKELHL
ncbi:HesA/MoeB/ThiF family protein [Aquimarina sp. U1-2]|uniref:HesA/MoeB/ThiF family protein n=1 Tax=Aquimarina sp. U1-2 TaxID=2823141 RepID=UPI001AEC7EBF|nr:HesA/MoeB/ThiF family protein [Aquimarina sp. U1-2]MBP2833792.1 HesA/MoeB/ThiF family protein [Aquimarina sp. U1-2]